MELTTFYFSSTANNNSTFPNSQDSFQGSWSDLRSSQLCEISRSCHFPLWQAPSRTHQSPWKDPRGIRELWLSLVTTWLTSPDRTLSDQQRVKWVKRTLSMWIFLANMSWGQIFGHGKTQSAWAKLSAVLTPDAFSQLSQWDFLSFSLEEQHECSKQCGEMTEVMKCTSVLLLTFCSGLSLRLLPGLMRFLLFLYCSAEIPWVKPSDVVCYILAKKRLGSTEEIKFLKMD